MSEPSFRPTTAIALACLLALCAGAARGQEGEVRRLFLPGYERALEVDLSIFGDYATEMFDELPARDPSAPIKSGDKAPADAVRPARALFIIPRPPKGGRPRFTYFILRAELTRFDTKPHGLRDAAVAGLLKTGHVSKSSMKQGEYKQLPLLRYSVKGPRLGGMLMLIPNAGLSPFPTSIGPSTFYYDAPPTRMLEAYQVEDGVMIWFRCVGAEIKEEDEKLLYSLIDSTRVIDTSRPSSSSDFYLLGREMYRQKDNAGAVAALSQALALEQQRQELSQPRWRQLVLTMADALRAAGELVRAKEVLEYGVGSEPANFYFHHDLARLHAHSGDLGRAVASLELAYAHAPKGSDSSAGALPDPLKDPAFRRFKDDRKFRDAVKAMKKRSKK